METALAEFAERQALTLFWYFGHINFSIQASELLPSAITPSLYGLIRTLESYGKIFLTDISLFEGFHTILASFFSFEFKVKFSAGASARKTRFMAIEKALLELYQAFILMLQLQEEAAQQTKSCSWEEISASYFAFNEKAKAAEVLEQVSQNPTSPDNFMRESRGSIEIMGRPLLVKRTQLATRRFNKTCVVSRLHGVDSFPLMKIDGEMTPAERRAAGRFGYSQQLRVGGIPFA